MMLYFIFKILIVDTLRMACHPCGCIPLCVGAIAIATLDIVGGAVHILGGTVLLIPGLNDNIR